MARNIFFEQCDVWWWSGYYIKVRNPLNHALERCHLSEAEKEQYEKHFGKKIITRQELEDWIIDLYAKGIL